MFTRVSRGIAKKITHLLGLAPEAWLDSPDDRAYRGGAVSP
jgi:hypothetical protein